jgi:hypothetical protein
MTTKIKSGNTIPTVNDLDDKQLGYNKTNKTLYIRDGDSVISLLPQFVAITQDRSAGKTLKKQFTGTDLNAGWTSIYTCDADGYYAGQWDDNSVNPTWCAVRINGKTVSSFWDEKNFDGMTNWFFCKKDDTLQYYSTNTKQVNVNSGSQNTDGPTVAGIVYVKPKIVDVDIE